MSKRILVTGAGTGASNNLIRSLKAEDPGFSLSAAISIDSSSSMLLRIVCT